MTLAKLSPYFTFENAKEAMDYYEKVFGATNLFRIPVQREMAATCNVSLDQLETTTIHGSFSVEGNVIFCSDSFGTKTVPSGFVSMYLDFNSENSEDEQRMLNLYSRAFEFGDVKVTMPLAMQFWGGKMGIFTDKYGIVWMLHSQPYSKLCNKE